MFLLCPAWRPHLQASGGDLRAACDQSEGGGCQAAPPPDGAHQSGAGSGEDCLLVLYKKYQSLEDQWPQPFLGTFTFLRG